MNTFGKIIEGSEGTVVFGNGIPAVTGEVAEVADDYFLFDTTSRTDKKGDRLAVPFASVVYFRFAQEG